MRSIGIKTSENSKILLGYGEGICLVLTQLLDKYLINQNFIFQKPRLSDVTTTNKEEISSEELQPSEKILTQIGFTTNNFRQTGGTIVKNSIMSLGQKRYVSAISQTTQGNWLNLINI